MKRLLFTILVSFLTLALPSHASAALQGAEKTAAVQKILKANPFDKPLKFSFKMIKHSQMMAQELVSTGNAAMDFPDKVLWKVDSPRASQFLMNGNLVKTGVGSNAKVIDITTNRRFQSISRNLANIKTRGLINETDFKVEVYNGNGIYQVDMTPLRRDLSQMFTMITLLADEKSGVITSIVLTEVSGDTSEIKILNPTHSNVDDSLFNVK